MTKFRPWMGGVGLSLIAALALAAGGCTQSASPSGGKDKGKSSPTAHVPGEKGHDDQAKAGDHKHGGWWCDEHGIPEAECSMCSSKVAKEFKAKGDWCQEHDRAKSQCFLCDPKLKEKYAAVYRAKYGKEPPPTEDDEKAKKGGKQ